jgi:hypothetical protein
MPICEIPSITCSDGNSYKAYYGLRHKEFIGAFGANGQVYSICNTDFTGPMTQVGNSVPIALRSGCPLCPLARCGGGRKKSGHLATQMISGTLKGI